MFYTFTKKWLNTVKDKVGDKFQDLTSAAWKLSVFEVFSDPNEGKYGPEKLRIRTLFTQCRF